MKIVANENSFELHISSSLTDNTVTSNNKQYNYKRLVIPSVLMNYFRTNNSNMKYVYLYYLEDSVFLSNEIIDSDEINISYNKRRIMKFNKKNTYFINLNQNSLQKHNIKINDNVLFIISSKKLLNSNNNISIELKFNE